MIDKLIEKYEAEIQKLVNVGGSHESDSLNIEYDTYRQFLQDLETLKKTISNSILSLWDGDSYIDNTLQEKVSEVNITKLIKDLGVDTDE